MYQQEIKNILEVYFERGIFESHKILQLLERPDSDTRVLNLTPLIISSNYANWKRWRKEWRKEDEEGETIEDDLEEKLTIIEEETWETYETRGVSEL